MNLWGAAGKECSQVTYTLGKETINFVLSYDLCQVDTGGLKLQMDTVAMKNYRASLYKKNIRVILRYFYD